jgi:hypothetical protein
MSDIERSAAMLTVVISAIDFRQLILSHSTPQQSQTKWRGVLEGSGWCCCCYWSKLSIESAS